MQKLEQFISNHWELWVAFAVVLVLVLLNEWLMRKKNAKSYSPAAVIDMMNHNDAVVIDLRPADAFRAGHIINAIPVVVDDLNQQRMEQYKTKPIILVCIRGIQSSVLAAKLKKQGFQQVGTLLGGMTAWAAAGLPMVKGNK